MKTKSLHGLPSFFIFSVAFGKDIDFALSKLNDLSKTKSAHEAKTVKDINLQFVHFI